MVTSTSKGWKRAAILLSVLGGVCIVLFSDNIDQKIKIIAVLIAAITLVFTVRDKERDRREKPAVGSEQSLTEIKQALADLVMRQWHGEPNRHNPSNIPPMPISWRLAATELMDHVENITGAGVLTFSVDNMQRESLTAAISSLRVRRLVITGGAGTGKTTFAVQILLHILVNRSPEDRVPVLLPAPRWDITRHRNFRDWLKDRLAEEYQLDGIAGLGLNAVDRPIDRGGVLPIVDGLDELPTEMLVQYVSAINASLTDDDEFIITCRTAEYARIVKRIGRGLHSTVVVEPDEISPRQAADYLLYCLPARPHPDWSNLIDALRDYMEGDELLLRGLATVVSTTLGLWMFRTVYIGPPGSAQPVRPLTPEDQLRFASEGTLREFLFSHLIEASITTSPTTRMNQPHLPTKAWDAASAGLWLSHLANHMANRSTRLGRNFRGRTEGRLNEFYWWRLGYDNGIISDRLRWIVSLFVGIISGSVVWIQFASSLRGAAFAVALICGFPLWVISMNYLGAASMRAPAPQGVHFALKGRVKLLMWAIFSSIVKCWSAANIFGLISGVLVQYALGVPDAFLQLLGAAWILGVTAGLAAGITKWLCLPVAREVAVDPQSIWRQDKIAFIVRIATASVVGTLFRLLTGLIPLTANPSWFDLLSTAFAFAIVGAVASENQGWPSCALASIALSRINLLPRQLMPFLDDMHRVGLLRTFGWAYQFRHAELQEYLERDR